MFGLGKSDINSLLFFQQMNGYGYWIKSLKSFYERTNREAASIKKTHLLVEHRLKMS